MVTASFHSDLRNFLFRSNPIPMFLYDGDSLRIRQANDAAFAAYGYTGKEFRSMTTRQLCPSSGPLPSETARTADLKTSCSLETHISKAGDSFEVQVQVTPFLDRQLLYGRHRLFLLSALRVAERMDANLICSELINRSLVEECPFGIYRLNLTTLRFEQANAVLLRSLGYSARELGSINVPGLYLEIGDRDRFLSELQTIGSIHNFETRFRTRNGGILLASISGYLGTYAATGHQYIQGYVRDITRQRELEEKLSLSLRMEAIGRLAGSVAHDFNNITQSISLSCELALASQRNTAIESKLLDIMQQAARAAEITRQLLAFSCGQVLQPRLVDINECVRKTIPRLTRVVGANVSVELTLDDSIDLIIVDPEQLTQVLVYLASYARAAMPQGGLLRICTSGCRGKYDPLKSIRSERYAVLTVSDSGIGIDEKTLQRIFEPFFSNPGTTLASGLGLSTVHGIIAQSKGRIECESSPGEGSTFRIFLPIAAGDLVGVRDDTKWRDTVRKETAGRDVGLRSYV